MTTPTPPISLSDLKRIAEATKAFNPPWIQEAAAVVDSTGLVIVETFEGPIYLPDFSEPLATFIALCDPDTVLALIAATKMLEQIVKRTPFLPTDDGLALQLTFEQIAQHQAALAPFTDNREE